MNDWISESSDSSEPYSSGSDGRRTTSFLMRLLFGEYGTRRLKGSTVKLGSNLQSPCVQITNALRFSSGRKTVSRIVPSSNTAETLGTGLCGLISSVLSEGLGSMFG